MISNPTTLRPHLFSRRNCFVRTASTINTPHGDRSAPIAPDIQPYTYKEPIVRSLVIGDKLWTLSQTSLGVSDIATLGQTSIIPLG